MSFRYRLTLPLVLRAAARVPATVEGARRRSSDPQVKGVDVSRESVEGVCVERYVPSAGARRPGLLLFVHGGAFVAGSAANSRRWPAEVARRLGMEAVSVDYRLAPEHPFPAGAEDVATVLRALRPMVAVGESAGGALVLSGLALAQQTLQALVLLCPATDLTMSGESLRANAGRDVLTVPSITWARDAYLAGHDPQGPMASPLHADLGSLPPTLLQVGDRDLVLDDSRRLAARLRAAGVPATLSVWPGMVHGFHGVPKLLPESRKAITEVVDWLLPMLAPVYEVSA